MLLFSNIDLAQNLPYMKGLSLKRIGHLAGNQIVVTLLDEKGQEIQFTAAVLEALHAPVIPDMARNAVAAARAQIRGIQEGRGESLILQISPEQAREQGLPIYWSVLPGGMSWLEHQLRKLGTMQAVADTHGLSYRTLADFARRQGIKNPQGSKARGSSNHLKRQQALEMLARGIPEGEVQTKLGVSRSTLWRWKGQGTTD